MESYKQEKIIIIMYEYLNDKREFYPISNVPLDKAKFFYKDDDGLFKLMAVSDYTVKTELNENRLYIVNAAIKDNSEKFQIGYEINFKAAEYESPLPVLSVLTKMYNQLIEDTRILHSYIRKQCFVADGKEQALVLPGLPAHTVWCMGENGKMFALPVSELYERFGNLIKAMEKVLDEYIEQKKEEIRGPAGVIDNVTASVNSNAGTPKVTVSLSETPERRKIDLKFENLKGDKPIKGEDYLTPAEKDQFTTETKNIVKAEGTKVIEQVKTIVAGNPATTNALTLSGKTRVEFEQDTENLRNEIKKEIGDLSQFFPTATYEKGTYYNKDGVIAKNNAITSFQRVLIDVSEYINKEITITLHHNQNTPSFVGDKNMKIIHTFTTSNSDANSDKKYTITLSSNAKYLALNNFGTYESVIVGMTKSVVDLLNDINKNIPTIVNSEGNSETAVMSQKAVTDYVKSNIATVNITPILTVHNKVPIVDKDVAIYLENMIIGISTKETKLIDSQNANIKFFNKEIALLPSNASGAGDIRFYFKDDNKYEFSKYIGYSKVTKKTGNKKVLFIGDSMTENLSYLEPLKHLSDSGDYKITSLGTQGVSIKHEGRGGWAAYTYTNKQNAHNKTNSFWDGKKFNFTWYMQNSGIEVPDYVFINLGTNDLIRGVEDATTDEEIRSVITASYQAMIDSIREYSTTIPIVLWLPPTRSLAGRNNHKKIDNCLRANKILIEKFDTKEYIKNRIYLMHTYLFINPYTDYNNQTIIVDEVEYVDCPEPIHPSEAGGKKIANGIIRQMMYIDELIN